MNAESAWNLVDMIDAYLRSLRNDKADLLAEGCEELLTFLEKLEDIP